MTAQDMSEIPQTAREVHLASRPRGSLTGEEFRLVDLPLAAPECGHVVVRNEYAAVAAFHRELMNPIDSDLLTRFEVGRALITECVGTVIATGDETVDVGDLVHYSGPWADHADATDVTVLDRSTFPDPVHHLAVPTGATALLGMRDIAGVTDGDVVLVSGAAGAVGSLAGQIAGRLRAARVIGTAGSEAKCRWLVDELGFDVAIDYHDADLAGRLRDAAPRGISVYFDNVGGAQFEAAVQVARTHARFALCGTLATQQAGAPWPRLDIGAAIEKDLTLRAFSPLHQQDPWAEWTPVFSRWLREGFVYPHTVVEGGVDAMPQAMIDLVAGRFRGQVAVRM